MPAITKIKEIADDLVVKELIDGKNTRLTVISNHLQIAQKFQKSFGRHSKKTATPSPSPWQSVTNVDDDDEPLHNVFTEFNMKIELDTPIIVPCVDSWMILTFTTLTCIQTIV